MPGAAPPVPRTSAGAVDRARIRALHAEFGGQLVHFILVVFAVVVHLVDGIFAVVVNPELGAAIGELDGESQRTAHFDHVVGIALEFGGPRVSLADLFRCAGVGLG